MGATGSKINVKNDIILAAPIQVEVEPDYSMIISAYVD